MYKILKHPISQSIGIMFRFKPIQPHLFVLNKEKKVPIHMIFCFQRIDAIWIDSQGTIVDIKQAKPFQLFITHKGNAKYLLETQPHFFNYKIGKNIKKEIKTALKEQIN